MGTYVCKSCLDEHHLKTEATDKTAAAHAACVGAVFGPCEICGDIRNDWNYKALFWTDSIERRINETASDFISKQLAALSWKIQHD